MSSGGRAMVCGDRFEQAFFGLNGKDGPREFHSYGQSGRKRFGTAGENLRSNAREKSLIPRPAALLELCRPIRRRGFCPTEAPSPLEWRCSLRLGRQSAADLWDCL